MLAALMIEHHYLRPYDGLSGANPITMRAPLRWVGVRAANWQSERVARVKQSDTQREWNLAAAAGARVSLAGMSTAGGASGAFGSIVNELSRNASVYKDYLVYYDIRVGDRYPDFTVIGPDLGVVVLEVKDWRLKSIVGARAEKGHRSNCS